MLPPPADPDDYASVNWDEVCSRMDIADVYLAGVGDLIVGGWRIDHVLGCPSLDSARLADCRCGGVACFVGVRNVVAVLDDGACILEPLH